MSDVWIGFDAQRASKEHDVNLKEKKRRRIEAQFYKSLATQYFGVDFHSVTPAMELDAQRRYLKEPHTFTPAPTIKRLNNLIQRTPWSDAELLSYLNVSLRKVDEASFVPRDYFVPPTDFTEYKYEYTTYTPPKESSPMHNFKPGDIVRCVTWCSNFTVGREYVFGTQGNSPASYFYAALDDTGNPTRPTGGMAASCFVLVRRAARVDFTRPITTSAGAPLHYVGPHPLLLGHHIVAASRDDMFAVGNDGLAPGRFSRVVNKPEEVVRYLHVYPVHKQILDVEGGLQASRETGVNASANNLGSSAPINIKLTYLAGKLTKKELV